MEPVKTSDVAEVGQFLGWPYSGAMPPNTGTHVRLEAELWARVDRYRKEHPDWPPPTRPQAIKEILEKFFEQLDAKSPPKDGKAE